MTIDPEISRLGFECPEPGYCYTIELGGHRQGNTDIEYCEQVAASPRYSYVDSIWNQEDAENGIRIIQIQVPVENNP